MPRTLRAIAWTLTAFLAAGVAVVSLRYALPAPPMAPPKVMANPFAMPFLPMHAIVAAVALLVGALQFIPGARGLRARWHRATGVVYVTSCLVAAPTGLILALGSTAGPVATAGFGILSTSHYREVADLLGLSGWAPKNAAAKDGRGASRH